MGEMRVVRGKRVFDVAASLLLIVLTSPVLVVVAVVTRLTLGKPVLFRQVRPGFRERPFVLYKFRTMLSAGHGQERDAQRLTRIGRFLRATSLDELPELFNVLKGDMSLVGPRPLLTEYLERYTPEQRRRHLVRPGITGWAQVNGRNAITWEKKFAYDLWYVDNQSGRLDLKILWMTLKQVVIGRGVNAPGHATMPEFLGSHGEPPLPRRRNLD